MAVSHMTVPGARLFYTDDAPVAEPASGTAGLPRLFVHGWLDTSDTWIHQLPVARTAARVLAVDLRGHGNSEAPDSAYDVTEFVQDLDAFLTNTVSEPVIIHAHSMGASIASLLAIRHPERVAGLVLIDPDYGGGPDERELLAPIADLADDLAVVSAVATLTANRDAATRDAHLREWHRREILRVPPFVVARSLRMNLAHPASIRFRPSADQALRDRHQPVLAFHRDPQRSRLERSLPRHPGSKVIEVPGRGHWIHQECPTLVNDETMAWLGELG